MSSIVPPKNLDTAIGTVVSERKRAIAYSMDLLIPGLYIWIGSYTLRLFGEKPDDTPYRYPGMLNSRYGVALVVHGYRIFTTDNCCYEL
ncbi:hypothetical protein [Chamaesiphon sp. OTE_8_metabat_110]|uniref:hypothetical protein n=1 Tax=Chamaesiphon sp. OTE_8_metabat_110 TaxID=2964696 RepID=UPI00286AAF2C|nr:hypothetical protein [Chamaesiphon sp. OTE_8_metabat_110]